MICIGHRGAMGYEPENTLRSITKAMELGADWVEIDVYQVEDELVVIHDDSLERTTNGVGKVKEQSLTYLRSLDAGKGEKIPFLREVFDLTDKRVGINVEIKDPDATGPVVDLIRTYLAAGCSAADVLVSSFDHEALLAVKKSAPEIQIGALVFVAPCNLKPFVDKLGAYSINPWHRLTTKRMVRKAHDLGLKVYPYTANNPRDIRRLTKAGVDGIITNFPDRIVS